MQRFYGAERGRMKKRKGGETAQKEVRWREGGGSSLAAHKVERDDGQTLAVPPAPHLRTAFARGGNISF